MSRQLPLVFLLLGNIVPLLGALFAGWDAASLVLIYWCENLIIGVYNILKMITLVPFNFKAVASRLFIILFFIVHYGGFAVGHGVFLVEFLELGDVPLAKGHADSWPGPFSVLQVIFLVMPAGFFWALIALTLSHGVSYVYNFILGGERQRLTVNQLMSQPYGRVIIMHVAIIAGGFLVMQMGSPVALLVALVAVKTVMDVVLHNRTHGHYLFGKNKKAKTAHEQTNVAERSRERNS